MHGMRTSSDQHPQRRSQLSHQERQPRDVQRRSVLRLRIAIVQVLHSQGLFAPAEIGEALGLLAGDVVMLLDRAISKDGDIAALQAVAIRLGLKLPLPPLVPWRP
jgi:hypothetical protein